MTTAPSEPRIDAAISIVIPAFNEEEIVARTILNCRDTVLSRFERGELICVDDASTDRTPAALDSLKAEFRDLRVYRNPRNLGHGPSLVRGLERSSGDLVFCLDSDYQIDPREFWALYERFERECVVIGARRARRDALSRRLASGMANRVICASYGLPYRDLNVPFKLFPRAALDQLLPVIPRDAVVPSTLLVIAAHRSGIEVRQAPVPHAPRATGSNSLTGRRFVAFSLAAARELVSFRRRVRTFR